MEGEKAANTENIFTNEGQSSSIVFLLHLNRLLCPRMISLFPETKLNFLALWWISPMFRPIAFYRITDLVAGIDSSHLALIDNYNNGDRHWKMDGTEDQMNRFAPYTVTTDPPWPLLSIHTMMWWTTSPPISSETMRLLRLTKSLSFVFFSLLILYTKSKNKQTNLSQEWKREAAMVEMGN